MKTEKILSVILVFILLFSVVSICFFNFTVFAELTSGSTGDCTWVLDGTILTISGNGATDGYASKGEYGNVEYEVPPWGRSITDVYINEGVTGIGNTCFYLCSKLKNITIAADVEYFGTQNFYDCDQLENVYIKDIDAWFDISFSDKLSNPLYYAENLFLNRELVKEISLPNTVNEIKTYAFMYKKIEKITLPNTITEIGDYAFYNCESLKYIKLPNAITNINKSTFRYCKSLTDIVIPDNVTKIGEYAFAGCSSIKNINISDNIISIGSYAFRSCDSLINVNIPKNVTSIGKSAFAGCKKLKAINVDKNNNSYSSFDGALYNKDKTNLIACPCAKTGDVIVPESVINIDSPNIAAIASGNPSGAFVNCSSIQNLVIPNNIKLSEYFFFGCQAENVVLSEGFTSVNQSAFNSSSVSNVSLPKSITKIEANAFNHSILTDVWYSGNENDRQEIEICNNNTNLLDAVWHYNVCDYNRHIYSNDSDTNCNKCDWVRKICSHEFDSTCDTNCNICDTVRDVNHSYDNLIDENCNVCGSKRIIQYITENVETDAIVDSDGKIANIVFVPKKDGKYTFSVVGESLTGIKLYSIGADYKGSIIYGTTSKLSITNSLKTGIPYILCFDYKGDNVSSYKVKVYKHIHIYDNDCDDVCNDYDCRMKRKPPHKYKSTSAKATTTKNGKIVKKCTVCGNVASTTPIKYVKTIKLSANSYVYNGKVKTPSVVIKDSAGKTLKKNTDYTIKYAAGRKNVGKYKVTVTFKGNYSGTKNLYFTINPVKTTVKTLTAGKKSLKVAITKKSTQVTGYQIQYATNKSFKSAKTKNVTSYKTTSVTLSKLSAKKTYYVRVRTYKTVKGVKYYSGWSVAKYKKTK